MLAPQSTHRPAMFSPAGPPPITMTSNSPRRLPRPPSCKARPVRTRSAAATPYASDNAAMTTVLGIDIGGTGIKGAPVDIATGQLLADRHRILTPHPATPDAVSEVVGELAKFFDWTRTGGRHVPRGDEGRRRAHRGERRPDVDRHRCRGDVQRGDRRARDRGERRRRRRASPRCDSARARAFAAS